MSEFRAAIVNNGMVTNVIVTDSEEFAASLGAIKSPGVSVGWTYDGSEFHPPLPHGNPLGDLKTLLKASVDSQAETERLKYITAGSGQSITYQEKAAEAVRYDKSGGVGEYPFLTSEVGVTADTLEEVAAIVLEMYNNWLVIGGAIEKIRLKAKNDIDAAPDEATARAVKPVWPG